MVKFISQDQWPILLESYTVHTHTQSKFLIGLVVRVVHQRAVLESYTIHIHTQSKFLIDLVVRIVHQSYTVHTHTHTHTHTHSKFLTDLVGRIVHQRAVYWKGSDISMD